MFSGQGDRRKKQGNQNNRYLKNNQDIALENNVSGGNNKEKKGTKQHMDRRETNFKNQNPFDNTSYSYIIERCPFYEINQHTYYSFLFKQIVKKLLGFNQKDEQTNTILIRASDQESIRKLYKIYFTLQERLVGVSTILHKCNSRMIYTKDGQKNKYMKLKKCVEAIFIRVPSEQQIRMKGFKQPSRQGDIMTYQQYEQLYNQAKDVEEEQKEEVQEEQDIADAIFVESFLQTNQQNIQSNNSKNNEEQKEQEVFNSDDDIESDEDEEEIIIKQSKDQNNDFTETKLWKQLQTKVLKLNPHINKVEKQDANLICNYKLTQQVIAIEPEKIDEMEKQSIKTMHNIEQKMNENKQINLQELNSEDQKEVLKGVLFKQLRYQGHQVQITNEKNQNKDINFAKLFQLQMVLTGQKENLKYLKTKIEDSKQFNFDELIQDERKKQEFISKFIDIASLQYGVSKNRILIIGLQKGSTIVNHTVSLSSDSEIEQYANKGTKHFEQVFKKVSIEAKSLIDQFQISDDYFNSEFDMVWPQEDKDFITHRGSLPNRGKMQKQRYHLPVGYKGYGINVQHWLQNESEWFGTTANEKVWIVLYHGTDGRGFKGISNDKSINPGNANAYGNTECRIYGGKIKHGKQMNTYLSDLAEGDDSAEEYCTPIQLGNLQYHLVFQCRVNPKHVRSPIDQKHYYTVENTYSKQSIRPYRVLLKQV